MTAAQIERLKRIELDMLAQFHIFCQATNLRYYIAYGTLLGAVRHKGFIPWDDDIDVVMPREDYEEFLRRGPSYLKDPLFVQTHESDPAYLNPYAKIRNSNTAFIERPVQDREMNHGIFIDIFPLDPYPMEEHSSFQRKKFILDERINMETVPMRVRPLKCKLVRPYAKWKYPTVEEAYSERERLFRRTKESAFLADNTWGDKEIIPKEWLGGGCLLEFEGLKLLAPSEYDKILRQEYGNYMEFPPIDQRCTDHDAAVIDTEKSYLFYTNRKGREI